MVTKRKMAKGVPDTAPSNNLDVKLKDKGENVNVATARKLLSPDFRSGAAVSQIMEKFLGKHDWMPGTGDFADALIEQGNAAANGDLAFASRMLATQAIVLDTIFAEGARRLAINMGDHLPAMEIYSRIVLKAQANSRATLEALAKLHQPREQTVRHVHVNEGGQAVIADQVHHHNHHQTGGQENGQSIEQPHATGTGAAGTGPALPCPDPIGNGVQIPSGEGCEAVQDARREE